MNVLTHVAILSRPRAAVTMSGLKQRTIFLATCLLDSSPRAIQEEIVTLGCSRTSVRIAEIAGAGTMTTSP